MYSATHISTKLVATAAACYARMLTHTGRPRTPTIEVSLVHTQQPSNQPTKEQVRSGSGRPTRSSGRVHVRLFCWSRQTRLVPHAASLSRPSVEKKRGGKNKRKARTPTKGTPETAFSNCVLGGGGERLGAIVGQKIPKRATAQNFTPAY